DLVSLNQAVLVRHLTRTGANLKRHYLLITWHSAGPYRTSHHPLSAGASEPSAAPSRRRRPRPRPPRRRRRLWGPAPSAPLPAASSSDSSSSAGPTCPPCRSAPESPS